jgi:cysteinyl-tRNA synthetase
MLVLRDLVSKTNAYIASRGKEINVPIIEGIARWVGQMLRMFGLGEGESTEIGWGTQDSSGEGVNVSVAWMIPHGVLSRLFLA